VHARQKKIHLAAAVFALCALGAPGPVARAQDAPPEAPEQATGAQARYEQERADAENVPLKERIYDALPDAVAEGLDFHAWGWLGYLVNDQGEDSTYWDAELSLAATKSFEQRLALTAQFNLIDANDHIRGELAQGFASARLGEASVLTIGKFNARFGVEGREFWDRSTGTASLLFGAQPQDIVGGMLTLPIADTGWKVRPFISLDFQGQLEFDQPPSGGVKLDYSVTDDLRLSLTNWVGPGIVLHGGEEIEPPYPRGGYGSASGVIGNWQGPFLRAERRGTLYFTDASATWSARPDLRLSGEVLLGTTGSRGERFGWWGALAMVEFDVTDRLHVYGRTSYLEDDDWLITGFYQRRYEVSLGGGYDIFDGVEVRLEYRHDWSDSQPDVHMVSSHLSFTF